VVTDVIVVLAFVLWLPVLIVAASGAWSLLARRRRPRPRLPRHLRLVAPDPGGDGDHVARGGR
jgi:hypothetical protein